MGNKRTAVGLSLLLLFALIPRSLAAQPPLPSVGPYPGLNISDLVEKADVIVVGRASIKNRSTEENTFSETGTIAVDRIEKGGYAAGNKALPIRHDHRSGTTSIGQAEYGIFFLIKDADGSFRTVDEFHPCAVAAPEFAPELTPFSSDPSAGALQKVALELINVLAASPDDISGTASAVASRKTAGVPSTAPQKLDYVAAFTALSHLPPDIQSAPLNAVYRKSASSATRLWAAAALINTGDEAPLDDVKGEVANPTEEEIPATFAVASAIQAHVHSARSVPALVTIMSSSSAQIRESAAQGLRRIGTESVEKPLVAALDDPDEKVRYLAVTGLAMATGQIKQFISITAYQSDEAGYLAYWRSWATARNIK